MMTTNDYRGRYPDNWGDIAKAVKDAAGWRCVRCGHPHETPAERVPCDERCDPARHTGGLNDGKQRVLTVHHLNNDKSDIRWWNLLPLCQVCHLQIQAKVIVDRPYRMFEHSGWFKIYVAGFYAWKYLGREITRQEARFYMDELLALELIR